MTNLIEKALIIGFGIFLASIFLSFSTPFLEKILYFNIGLEDELNDYLKLINDVDKGILSIIENPTQIYQKKIYYPDNLNITFENNYARFQYHIQGKISDITLKYNYSLKSCKFYGIAPQSYLYQVYIETGLIKIEIT